MSLNNIGKDLSRQRHLVQLLTQEHDRADGHPDGSSRHLHRAAKIILETCCRSHDRNGVLSVTLLPVDAGGAWGAPPGMDAVILIEGEPG